jgi:hypothetical protein
MTQRNAASLILSALSLLAFPACVFVLDGDGSHWDHGHWHGGRDAIQGSGVSKTEDRTVGDFKRVEVNCGADVAVSVGSAASLSVTGDDNLLQYLVTEVRDGALVVEMKSGSYSSKIAMKLVANVPQLDGVVIRGSSDIDVTNVSGDKFSVSIAGSGDVRAKGKVGAASVHVTGSGDVRLAELEARDVNVEISGSGNADVWATESLAVSVAGSGDVVYRGDPTRITKSVAGSGSIVKH